MLEGAVTERRFVIAGTGRSGTKWCATALRVAGVLCGHEQVFCTEQLVDMGPQTWHDFEGDASLAAVPFLDRHDDCRRVLVVRHPLDVAASFLHVGPFTHGSQPRGLLAYLERRLPTVLDAENEVTAALQYWVLWNQMALAVVDEVARLEDLDLPRLLGLVKRDGRWPLYPFDRPVNASAARSLGDEDLIEIHPALLGHVEELARELGYEVPW